MNKPAPLNLERYAALSAEMASGANRKDVLARAEVTEETWTETQSFWLTRMANDAARQRFDLSMRFSKLVAEAEKVLKQSAKTRARRLVQARRPIGSVVGMIPTAPVRPELAAQRASFAPSIPAPQPSSFAPPVSYAPPSIAPAYATPPPASYPSYAPSGYPSQTPAAYATPPPPSQASYGPPSYGSHAPASMPPAAAPTLRLSLEQFAALRAELVVIPEAEHEAARERFGVDNAAWQLEESGWQRRLADKEVFGQYLKRFQYYRALMMPRR